MTPAALGLLREQQAEHRDADRRPGDLPFALETVGEKHPDQRPDRRRDGDDEGVGQRFGHPDALRDQQRRHPAGEAVIADGLKQIVDHQHDGAAAIARRSTSPSRRRACARLRRRRFPAAAALRRSARICALQFADDARRPPRCGRAAPASAAIPARSRRIHQMTKAPIEPMITTQRQPSSPRMVCGTSCQARNATTGTAVNMTNWL